MAFYLEQKQYCFLDVVNLSALLRKNAVSANIKHSRYFIKHPISGQPTTVAKCCMDVHFDMVDTAFSYDIWYGRYCL